MLNLDKHGWTLWVLAFPWFPKTGEGLDFTLKDLHGQDSPGVVQIGDVQVACGVTGQADVQHPEKDCKSYKHSHTFETDSR